MLPQNGRSPRPERRRSASERPGFVKHSRSEPALSTYDECPVSRQAQPGKIESDQAVALQYPANFGLAAGSRAVEIAGVPAVQIIAPCKRKKVSEPSGLKTRGHVAARKNPTSDKG